MARQRNSSAACAMSFRYRPGLTSVTGSSEWRKTMTNRSRWAALVVLCVGVLMIVLDATVVNVALPAIQNDLGFSQSGLAWVVNAYLIAFGGLLLLAGRLGDLVSRRGKPGHPTGRQATAGR